MRNDLNAIESGLRRGLSVTSVSGLKDFPFATYTDVVTGYDRRDVEVLTAFNPNAVPALGSAGERAMYYGLTWSPVLISAILVIASFLTGNFWLLGGIPLAFLGMLLSTPAFMKSIGSLVLIVSFVMTVYSWFQGDATTVGVLGAYVAGNYLPSVARTQCDMIIRDAIRRSELVLVWLHIQGSVVIRPRDVQPV